MMLPIGAHSIVAVTFERLLYCVVAGTALVAIVSAAVSLLPARNSQTRFAVWFSALLAVAVLPFLAFLPARWFNPASLISGRTLVSSHTVLTISTSWAEYIVLAWGVLAAIGVVRVAFGLCRLRSLRRSSFELDYEILDPEITNLIARRSGMRPVSLLVSSQVQVPTAMGFFRPAILLPPWLIPDYADEVSDVAANEHLKYILLHELAHLRRWDDWTNLAQQLVKSVLFFHPGILWIERKLALDREMACDDAVVAETGSPRSYAQCLTQVAEKSFLRRQIVLAQAAISRVKQLSSRVASILDHQPSHTTRIWKPAIPLVVGVAVLCAVSASNTTELIGFSDRLPAHREAHVVGRPVVGVQHQEIAVVNGSAKTSRPEVVPASTKTSPAMKAVPADLKYHSGQRQRRPLRRNFTTAAARPDALRSIMVQRASVTAREQDALESNTQARLVMSSYVTPGPEDPASAHTVVLVLVTGESVAVDNQNQRWQISAWELWLYMPAHAKQIPRKT